ncbi:MAG: SurA N-terminal domain-containing protein [Spirochaetales bacterium]
MASKEPSEGKKQKQQSLEKRLKPKTSNWTSKPVLYVFSVVILGIIVVSFVAGPIVGQFAGPSASTEFGSYRGRPIELKQGSYMQNQVAQLGQQMGNPQNTAEMYQLYRRAFEQTLLHTAVLMEAEDGGMSVSTDRVNNQIVQLPQFQEGDSFSQSALDDTSQEELMNLRTNMREGLIYEKFVQDVLEGFHYSSEEIAFFASQGSLERRFEVAQFAFDEVPQEVVSGYAEENPELFRNAEVSMINLGPDRELAEEVLELLENGEDTFENLAEEFSIDEDSAENQGQRGRVFQYQIEQEVLESEDVETLFSTSEGETTPIIDTESGYTIYRLDSPTQQAELDDEDTIEVVREYLEEFEQGILEDYMFEQAENFAFDVRDGADFENSLDEYRARRSETNFFPINYGGQPFLPRIETVEGETLGSAQQSEEFFRSAFSVDIDETTDPIVLDETIVVLMPVEEREQDPADTERIAATVPQLYQQYQGAEIERTLLDQSLIEDNFNQAFSRNFLQPQQQQPSQGPSQQPMM